MNLCGCVEFVNGGLQFQGQTTGQRLMPRTEELPIYTTQEFNDKVRYLL